MNLLHRISHWLGWNYGRVESGPIDADYFWIGFQCDTCGKVNHAFRQAYQDSPPLNQRAGG